MGLLQLDKIHHILPQLTVFTVYTFIIYTCVKSSGEHTKQQ